MRDNKFEWVLRCRKCGAVAGTAPKNRHRFRKNHMKRCYPNGDEWGGINQNFYNKVYERAL